MFVIENILNTDCNLCCYFCFAKDKKDSNLTPASKFRHVLDNIDRITNEEHVLLKYYGGEVTLHQDELIRHFETFLDFKKCYSGKKAFHLVIITNATIYPNDRLMELIKETDCNITVSLEINEEYHNKIRHYKNGSGSFDQVMSNIKRYHSELGYKIGIQTVLSKECIEHMDVYLDFIDRYKDHCGFVFIPMFGCNEIDDSMLEKLPGAMKMYRDRMKYYFENEDRCPISLFQEMRSLLKYYGMHFENKLECQTHCLAGAEQLTLLGDKMYACSRFYHDGMKYLTYKDLDHFILSKDKWRQQIELDDECMWCEKTNDMGCIGRCLAAVYKNGNTNIPEVCKYNIIIGQHAKLMFSELKDNDNFIKELSKMINISTDEQISNEHALNMIAKLKTIL